MWSGADPRTRRASSVSARWIHDEAGDAVGAALAATDITDLMQALKVKDEFLATVSHELRTPLTSIAGYVSILLEDEDLPAHVVGQLRVVDRNTARLTALVKALLQEAHHIDGIVPLTCTELDLATIVTNSVRAAEETAQASGVELQIDVSGPVVAVADPQRIGQVVDNLVSNGIKHTPQGGRVLVAAAPERDGAGLRVVDTGTGIPDTDLPHLFTRFFRTRAAAESAIQGIGLGLSISKAIIESHGGRIEVESEVGRGTEFRVWLPAVPPSAA